MAEDLDLLVTWGREFCAVLPDGSEATGQDAYEAHWDAFDRDPDLAFFRAMDAAAFSDLAAAARDLLEIPSVTADQMREAVRRTIALAG
jgi:hypothetical protein